LSFTKKIHAHKGSNPRDNGCPFFLQKDDGEKECRISASGGGLAGCRAASSLPDLMGTMDVSELVRKCLAVGIPIFMDNSFLRRIEIRDAIHFAGTI
jgi:hypothetical protein